MPIILRRRGSGGGSGPAPGPAELATIGADTATSTGTSVNSGAVANTKGAYSVLTTSSPINADGFLVRAQRGNLGAPGHANFLIDIAVGPAGLETVIVPNLFLSMVVEFGPTEAWIPIPIAQGSRIVARAQSQQTNATFDIEITLYDEGEFSRVSFSRATSYGASTADSGGAGVDPGGVANTKGLWTPLSASIANPISSAILCVGKTTPAETYAVGISWLIDVGMGAAGAESVIADNIQVAGAASLDMIHPNWIALPVTVPVGTRIAARAQCSDINATDRLLDVALLGFD